MNVVSIDLNYFVLSGGGKLGESYTRVGDPNVLLKLYSTSQEQLGLDEYERARDAFRAGIPCPEPGDMVRTRDGRLGILYKRILGKKSYARALSESPERLEEYAASFAAACKTLHAIKPEPGRFPSAKDEYKKEMGLNPFLTDEEKDGLALYIDNLPDGDTVVHGDLHHGNVIFTEDGRQYFIDLGDLCVGSPLFDLGIIMLQTCWLPEETERQLYHIGLDTSRAFWEAFVLEYFVAEASLEETQALLTPYAFLRILRTERLTGTPILRIRPKVREMIGIR